MTITDTSRSEPGDLEQQVKTLRNDIASLAEDIKGLAASRAAETSRAVREHVNDLAGQTREMAEGASRHAKSAVSTIEDQIAEKPVQSALVALLIGIVIGSLGRR